MKKLIFTLFTTIMTISGMAQTIGEAFYIYRNDGQFNAFLRDEVDSITYSYYNTDSLRFEEIVTQLVYTKDSVYWIPMASIDSVAFVTPQTVYQDNVVNLNERLFDYVTSVDGINLSLSKTTPTDLLPKIGEKLVALELSQKFPYGFLGKINNITEDDSKIIITCDTITLEDAVKRFFTTVRAASINEDDSTAKARALDDEFGSWQKTFVLNTIKIPIEFTGVVKKKDILNFAGKAKGDFFISPRINLQLNIAIDETILLSYYNIHAITDFETKEELEIGGEAKGEEKIPFSGLSKDILLPYGFTYYVSPGVKYSINGELAVGATFTQTGRHTMDVTYYPLLSINPISSMLFNNIDQDIKLYSSESDWHYLIGKVTFKGGIFIETGVGFLNHKIAKVGGEFDLGLEFKSEFKFDWDLLKNADSSTTLYESIQNLDHVDVCPYVGLRGIVAVADERIKFAIGKDWDAFWNIFFLRRRILPSFENVKTEQNDLTSVNISSGITNDCLLPMKVGFSIFDPKGELLQTTYNDRLYINRLLSFSEYGTTFKKFNQLGRHTIYPVVSIFGYDLLATPCTVLELGVTPITLDVENIGETTAKVWGRIEGHELLDETMKFGLGYEESGGTGTVSYDASSIDANGAFSVEFMALKPNTTYKYFAYFTNDGVTYYGDYKEFTTKQNGLCPDDRHPHMIDLGLPSGTLWSCCNIGARNPMEIGNSFAWGENKTKDSYSWGNYAYWNDLNGNGGIDNDELRDLGIDISGTDYDSANAIWGGSWRMPTNDEFWEMIDNTQKRMVSNDIQGYYFKGPNDNEIFIPCNRENYRYWTSEIANPSIYYPNLGKKAAKNVGFKPDWVYADWSYRYEGLLVRPISNEHKDP